MRGHAQVARHGAYPPAQPQSRPAAPVRGGASFGRCRHRPHQLRIVNRPAGPCAPIPASHRTRPTMLTLAQAAALTGMNCSSILRAIKRGAMTGTKDQNDVWPCRRCRALACVPGHGRAREHPTCATGRPPRRLGRSQARTGRGTHHRAQGTPRGNAGAARSRPGQRGCLEKPVRGGHAPDRTAGAAGRTGHA